MLVEIDGNTLMKLHSCVQGYVRNLAHGAICFAGSGACDDYDDLNSLALGFMVRKIQVLLD